MSDKALQNAMAERDRLAVEINQYIQHAENLKREISIIDRFITDWHKFAGTDEPVNNSSDAVVQTYTTRKRTFNNPTKEEVGEWVRKILLETGAPMTRKQLFEALNGRGVVINGSDPQMVLSTMLWRMGDKFIRLPKNGYWPADQPYRPLGYDPSVPRPFKSREEFTAEAEEAMAHIAEKVLAGFE